MKKVAIAVLVAAFLVLWLYYRPTLEYEGSGGIGAVLVGLPGVLLLLLIVLAVIALALVGSGIVLRAIFRRAFKK
jgi:hypothetical protein